MSLNSEEANKLKWTPRKVEVGHFYPADIRFRPFHVHYLVIRFDTSPCSRTLGQRVYKWRPLIPASSPSDPLRGNTPSPVPPPFSFLYYLPSPAHPYLFSLPRCPTTTSALTIMEEHEKHGGLFPSDLAIDPSRAASTVVSQEDEHHVDVDKAKAEFAALQRTFSGGRDEKADLDIERGEDEFDLREYFTSTNDAHAAAGIRPKHVGVTWENLRVEVPDIGHKVSDDF